MSATPGPDALDSLRALFDRAVEVPQHARAAWLDRHVPDTAVRARLERLLQADSSSGYLDTPAGEHAQRLAPDVEEARPESLIGQTVGPFRLLRLLGQGGMAAVFLGERERADFEQRCAVKLLRRGLYSQLEQRLFQRERRVLATLEHPNVARLIDGGVTDAGIPYLAMEYIDGQPLTAFADAHGLDAHARLRLLLTAARATEAAHRLLIVHRDIKPSNLLVTADGTLKLLDFGIAKLLEDDSEDGTRTYGLYTPGYAAPEQRAGDPVTAATDVYALGVVLHELLVGVRPAQDAPRKPSAVAAQRSHASGTVRAGQLRGDLDTILLKALANEPERRYPDAGALGADIERYLEGKPVLAHPPSQAYVLGKFVRRHRFAVLAGGALALATVAALGVALWQARDAREQARIAALEAQSATQVRDFLLEIFENASSSQPETERPTVVDLLNAAAQRTRERPLPDATRARFLVTLARSAVALDEGQMAVRLADEARRAVQRLPDADPQALLETKLLRVAGLAWDEPRQAHAELRPLLPALRQVENAVTTRGAQSAALVLFRAGQFDEAVAMAWLYAARAERVFGADSLEARGAALLPGTALASVRRFGEARRALEPAIARWRAAGLPPQKPIVEAVEALARILAAHGEYRRAEDHWHDAIRMVHLIDGRSTEWEAYMWTHIGASQIQQERYAAAAASLAKAFALHDVFRTMESVDAGRNYARRAALRIAMRDFDAAQRDLEQAIGRFERPGASPRDSYPQALYQQAALLLERDRLDEAQRVNQRSLDLRRELFGSDNGEVASNIALEARILLQRGLHAAALERIDAATAMFARTGLPLNADALRARELRARILLALGRNREALLQATALADDRRRTPTAVTAITQALALQAQAHARLGQRVQAARVARAALALRAPAAWLTPGVLAQLRQIAEGVPAPRGA